MSINLIILFKNLYTFTIYFILFSTIRRQKFGQVDNLIIYLQEDFYVKKRRKYLQAKRWSLGG